MTILNRFLEQFDALGVFHMSEGGIEDVIELFEKALIDEGVEESHFIGAVIEDITDAEFDGLFHGAHREGDYITLKYARICYQVTTMLDCIIVGGGPVGLFAAAELQKQKRSFRLLEASDTLGGQTLTLYPEKEIVDIPGIPSIKAKDYIASLIQNIDPVNVSLGVKVLSYVHAL